MAIPTATPAPCPSPHEVSRQFVGQYYLILHQRPECAHKFYQDSSVISRPDSNGVMASATTMQAINDMILSMDYKNYQVKILTTDSQPSYNEGVFVLVTGYLIGMDKIPQKFTQSFFLAPQTTGGFFILNDVFRFLHESQPNEIDQISVSTPIATDSEPTLVQDSHVPDPATTISEAKLAGAEEASTPSENGDLVAQDKVTVDPPVQPHVVSEIRTFIAQEDVPKKSYASVVKDMKGSTSSKPVYVPTTKLQPAPTNPEKPFMQSTSPCLAPEALAAKNNTISESSNSSNSHEAVKGHSVYIWNLPVDATVRQVEDEFKKFGPIKPLGVQVRNHKFEQGCFGFVEFESPESMKAAIEASPVVIGCQPAFVKEKRTKTRVVEGHSIYIGNLPVDATARQVEEEFKKFGPIKPHGVQVRDHKFEQGCFGFVEFESPESMKAAIEASPIVIGCQPAFVKAKRIRTRESTSSKPVYVPTTKLQPAPTNPEKPFMQSAAPCLAPEVLATKNNAISQSSKSSNFHDFVEGHSIYIGNLPMDATARQVEEEFKKFGPIRPHGVQVRDHKFEQICFGFVEFESPESMKAAIEASPVVIGCQPAFVKEKRTRTRVTNGVLNNGNGDSGTGHNLPGRGGFHRYNHGGRQSFHTNQGYGKSQSFHTNQGYGKSEFKNQGVNSGRGQHPSC